MEDNRPPEKSTRRKLGRALSLLAGIFTYTSRSSLTFYFLHYLLIGWPLALIYIYSGKYNIYNLMGSLPAFFCGLAAVCLLGFVLRILDRCGSQYKLEWFLEALVRKYAAK